MFKALRIISSLLTPVALICAMVMSGFAHTPAVQSEMTPELAAYVAAGGLLSDICGNTGGQNSAVGQKCEACRLAGGALIPRDCHGIPLRLLEQTRIRTFVAVQLHNARPLDPARLTRAPPQA